MKEKLFKRVLQILFMALCLCGLGCSSLDAVGKKIYSHNKNANHLRAGMEIPKIVSLGAPRVYVKCIEKLVKIRKPNDSAVEFHFKAFVDAKKVELIDFIVKNPGIDKATHDECYRQALDQANKLAYDKWDGLESIYIFNNFLYFSDGTNGQQLKFKIHDENRKEELIY